MRLISKFIIVNRRESSNITLLSSNLVTIKSRDSRVDKVLTRDIIIEGRVV